MLIKIDTQKLIEKNNKKIRHFTTKNTKLNQTNYGKQPILELPGRDNKLKWYMDKYFHKLENDHLKLFFNLCLVAIFLWV